jgi:hypothetical protein
MAWVNPWDKGPGSGKCESSPQTLTIWSRRFEPSFNDVRICAGKQTFITDGRAIFKLFL